MIAAVVACLTTCTLTPSTSSNPHCGTLGFGTSTTCSARQTLFVAQLARGGARPHVRGRTPSPPPPPPIIEEEEARLIQRVLEDSKNTHDERQWVGLDTMLTLSAVDDVVVPELEVKEEVLEEKHVAAFHPGLVGQRWSWSFEATDMADAMGAGSWCPTPQLSPEREPSPRGKVVQACSTFQGPSSLWTPPPYINLTGDKDDNGDA
ncbi:histone-lysine n-methyltransferase atxr3 [Hordeum vulgare]|nr:histone-lysine n-methyltransferase atxr3 [Hordeum vulgare]